MTSNIVDGDQARDGLQRFGLHVRDQIADAINTHDPATQLPQQLIIVTGATLSDYHYLIRREQTSLLALGQWEKVMAPPSLAEFLQLIVHQCLTCKERIAYHLGK